MTRERVKSAERTSFGTPGTTETLGALHSPPVASGELCRLLSSTPFQSSYGECRLKLIGRLHHDEGGAGYEVVGLEQAINRRFRDEVILRISELCCKFAG